MLINLVTNAVHAMPQGGSLEVGVQMAAPASHRRAEDGSPGPLVHLFVSDTGVGMSSDVQARALEPFFTTKEPGEGTGLGLSVVHGIIESHGGRIDIESEIGRGTRFSIYLPAARDLLTPTRATSQNLRGRILLAEDQVTLLRLMRRALSMSEFEVSSHLHGLDALDAFRADPDGFDIVVTDHMMPKMTGLQLAEQVHELRPHLPIILISGVLPSDHELAQAGVRRVLAKPYSLESLAATLEELAPRRK